MRVLIDTHAFLWEVLDDQRLSTLAQETWDEPSNELLISAASLWEISIKVGSGKLAINRPVDEFFDVEIARNGLKVLPITATHAARAGVLPRHHGDPFDRMLVAQSICEGVPILSIDALLDAYGVPRIW